jgi:hypothetical protein
MKVIFLIGDYLYLRKVWEASLDSSACENQYRGWACPTLLHFQEQAAPTITMPMEMMAATIVMTTWQQ